MQKFRVKFVERQRWILYNRKRLDEAHARMQVTSVEPWKFVSQSNLNPSKRDYFVPWGSSLVPGKSKEFSLCKPPVATAKQSYEALTTVRPSKTVTIPDPIIVQELAQVAGQKPFRVIADLMQLNIFAKVNYGVDFKTAAKVLLKYGIIARKLV
jgi:Translation initiation factor IF-2, N-terminal region